MGELQALKESIASGNSVKYEPFRLDRETKPADFKCPKCGEDLISWFWLESEIPGVMPSHWERHLCTCMVLSRLRSRRSYVSFGLGGERVNEKAAMEVEEKIKLINKLIKRVEKAGNNSEYYRQRFGIADDIAFFQKQDLKFLIWELIFECQEKEEADYYLKILGMEQPRPETPEEFLAGLAGSEKEFLGGTHEQNQGQA